MGALVSLGVLVGSLGMGLGIAHLPKSAGPRADGSGRTPIARRAGRWEASALASLPVPLSGLTLAYARGALWVAGGLANGTTSTRAVWRLAWPRGRSWTRVGSLPQARHDAALCAVPGGLLFAGGGLGSVSDAQVWRLGFPPRGTGPLRIVAAPSLPTPRSDLSCVTGGTGAGADAGVFVAGGYDGLTYEAPVLRLGPAARAWQAVTRLTVPVRYTGLVRTGRSVLTVGGLTPGGLTPGIWQVPLDRRPAKRIGVLPEGLQYVQAVRTDGTLVLLGGENAGGGLVTGTPLRLVLPAHRGDKARLRPLSGTGHLTGRAYGAMAAVPGGGLVYAGGITGHGVTRAVLWIRPVPPG